MNSIKVNENFLLLPESYLFSEVARKVKEFQDANPDVKIIRMGIGDVTRPLCRAAIEAMHRAVDDEADTKTFHGYGPEQGYAFLRDKIADYDYARLGIDIQADEIFIGDGAKSDLGNFFDILAQDLTVAVTDPVYPVYVDTNVMGGRGGHRHGEHHDGIIYIPVNKANGYTPQLPEQRPDVIYLCSPNNPTGTAMTRKELREWVDYARENSCLILFDSAYEAYIHSEDVPHSIYEIEGAKEVAVEFRSFSKTAGFTGIRCGYTVVPFALKGKDSEGNFVSLNRLWNRRQCTKFNGASYISQRAAEAVYSPEGRKQIMETVAYYMENARMMRESLSAAGYEIAGGIDSPYIWLKTPDGMTSWEFFDWLLKTHGIVGTPGSGFGAEGEGHLRLTAFNTHEATNEALLRVKSMSYLNKK
ncbi:MAG: LL-diaminopimelate aminotransferase [Muribaculaceae bacterium]|nr:LL-diaminopimelate aminotransferase [Muribaculaceae bacterium]